MHQYDLLFFIIVLILLLNIIFGIIIDQFGSLRDQQAQNQLAKSSGCFICGIDRKQFANHGLKLAPPITNGFRYHIDNQHNMWDYIYFLEHLNLKHNDELTGPESFVAGCFRMDNTEWIPRDKAMFLGST
jgi:hypothetical protein